MEGKPLGDTGLRMGGIGCYIRWAPRNEGMVTPGAMLAQSFKSITCFGHLFYMKGAIAEEFF